MASQSVTLSPFPSPFDVPIDQSLKGQNYKRRFVEIKTSFLLSGEPLKQNKNGKILSFANPYREFGSTWPSSHKTLSIETISVSGL